MTTETAGGVLLAIDPSPDANALISAAATLASQAGQRLTMLYVLSDEDFETLRKESSPESGFLDVIFDDTRSQLHKAAVDALGEDGAASVHSEVVRGEPDEQILQALRDGGYAYGVIGVRSRSRVSKLVFGSTAQSILLLSPCPILAVPIEA